ncbi:xanthine dehydrogenase family protein molybdopterin-binding subunit [Allomuricauda sp. NBRC 101325]|uniref:xanthine dehydrogenase family protein molybdopterin-binding subunit n=1 Tax=Allomuricauda sp. NBRC 101325 TaxID=1113758 RepID=UPI0024A014F8|nr:molybdopterin cofactor-binding domain-containing protein [Muricauda sp. NBRC 101325]GLU44953.1 isoquinoline 1-oxidoreductase subunit beta [Muricauda sp. NBRC 101325]
MSIDTAPAQLSRRTFLKSSSLAGGGLLMGFSWMMSCKDNATASKDNLPEEWVKVSGYIKIATNGMITIMSPNPEGGQNVKTSMPMIIAEELDAPWSDVIVEQAPLDTENFTRQFIGGSQAIRQGWQSLRTAGATVKQMLKQAAAEAWQVPIEEISASEGQLFHAASDKSGSYGEFATAAANQPIPENVVLKDVSDFKLIGTSQKNVDVQKIITGKPLFGIDTYKEGMLIAMLVQPPAFGMKLTDFDASEVKGMPGIKDVFAIKTYNEDYKWQFFDTCSFMDKVVIVGESTWQVMQAKKQLESKINWEVNSAIEITRDRFGTDQTLTFPAGLESTEDHLKTMNQLVSTEGTEQRKDGNPDKAFAQATKIIEKTYAAPLLAHNCMEPMNFFAHVTENSAYLVGPLQKPEYTEKTVSARLGIPLENIEIEMTRLGGGYGKRSYAHWLVEAAIISQKMNAPIKLVYSREDDMTSGIYRPTYMAKYRAALGADNSLLGLHVNAGGIPESPLYANRFPAGAIENYLAENWIVPSNITSGSFRAPSSNFMASAEQSFLDELAEEMGKDPIAFRLELLEKAKTNPVGEQNDYDADRYAGVLKLVRDMSDWGKEQEGVFRGVSAYFCHNTYAAIVVDLIMENEVPLIQKVYCAADCGIVVNPDAANNLIEGAIVDGIGNAMYGKLAISNGIPEQQNFDRYRMIRMTEAPKAIEVRFVENSIDPTGLGEPAFPPVMPALANALYKAKGKRFDHQPYSDYL